MEETMIDKKSKWKKVLKNPLFWILTCLVLYFSFSYLYDYFQRISIRGIDIEAEIAKARAGDPDDLICLTLELMNIQSYRPDEAAVKRAIEHTKSDNVFEQFYGVTILSKDNSEDSENALREYVEANTKLLEDHSLGEKA